MFSEFADILDPRERYSSDYCLPIARQMWIGPFTGSQWSAGVPSSVPTKPAWRVGAVLHWLWAFATPETTVYAIRPGCGFEDAATILGADFAGVLVRDGWA